VSKLLGARGIRSAFETCGIIIVLFTLSWPLAAALLVSAPLLTPLIARLSSAIGTASKASQAASSEVSAAADEVVENMRVVKLFAQQQAELQRFQGLLGTAHQLALKVGVWPRLHADDVPLGCASVPCRWLSSHMHLPGEASYHNIQQGPPVCFLPAAQVLRLQALLDGSSRVRNTLCVLATLGLGAYMALHSAVSIGTCYSFFVFRRAGLPPCCCVPTPASLFITCSKQQTCNKPTDVHAYR
jgi:ABC-type multidrug transport system fused ATPase/permease subunit